MFSNSNLKFIYLGNYRNPYFLAPGDRKLQYDQFFNVKKDKLLIEA
jgi:hypothetical protein